MLACAPNLRDIGGKRAANGRFVRHGIVVRSEAWSDASGQDLSTLAYLGIRTVLDLRSGREKEQSPGHWATQDISLHAIEVTTDPRASAQAMEARAQNPNAPENHQ